MRRVIALVFATSLVTVAAACGGGSSSCEEAAEVLQKCNGGDSGDSSGDSSSGEKCEGEVEKIAECVIKNKSSCEKIESTCYGGLGTGTGTGGLGDGSDTGGLGDGSDPGF